MATDGRLRAYLIQLSRYGAEGWQWMEVHPNGRVSEHRTDPQGEGLWGRGSDGWTQGRGHMQFHLPATADAAAAQIMARMRDAFGQPWNGDDGRVDVTRDDTLDAFTVTVEKHDRDGWWGGAYSEGDPVIAATAEDALADVLAHLGDSQDGPRRVRVWQGIFPNYANTPNAESTES